MFDLNDGESTNARSRVDPKQLTIHGGRLIEKQLGAFLTGLVWPQAGTWWAIVESVGAVEMTHGTGPWPASIDPGDLERLELFGKAGHFSIRRDENIVRWHFIGESGPAWPIGYDVEDYWRDHDAAGMWYRTRSLLLWGEQVGSTGVWYDDRVAWADLRYPGMSGVEASGQRAALTCREYSRAGRIEFVRFVEVTLHTATGEVN